MTVNQLNLEWTSEIIGKRLFDLSYSEKFYGSYYISAMADVSYNLDKINNGDYFTMEDYSGKKYTMLVYKNGNGTLDCISTECITMLRHEAIITGILTESIEIKNILFKEYDMLPDIIRNNIISKKGFVLKERTITENRRSVECTYVHAVNMGKMWVPLVEEIARLAPVKRMNVPIETISKELWSRIKTYQGEPVNWLLNNDEVSTIWCMTLAGYICYDSFSEYGVPLCFTLKIGGIK